MTLSWSGTRAAPRVAVTVGRRRYALRAPGRRERMMLPAGTYRDVRVSTRGRWSVRIG